MTKEQEMICPSKVCQQYCREKEPHKASDCHNYKSSTSNCYACIPYNCQEKVDSSNPVKRLRIEELIFDFIDNKRSLDEVVTKILEVNK